MSASEPAAAIQVTTYFIVPVVPVVPPTEPIQPAPSQSQRCLYFDSAWNPINGSPIQLRSGQGVNFVGFVQPPPTQAQGHIPEDCQLAPGVTLLAAVAKTLTPSGQPASPSQPNVFVASTPIGNPTLVLPVCDNTRRGVILIFMSPNGINVANLLATGDPEISNSTGISP
jgi:hypothetical protein